MVPIRSIFQDKIKVEDLKRNFPQTELATVAKYILNENVQIKNSVAISAPLAIEFSGNEVKKKYSFLKTTKLSGKSYGPLSEENIMFNTWHQLIENVPIYLPGKFVKDLENSEHFWLQKLLGAYFSQGLAQHRSASTLYRAFIYSKMKKGSWTEEDNEKLLAFYKAHDGKPSQQDWKALAFEMERTSRARVLISAEKIDAPKRSKFSLDEDRQILEHVNRHFDISSAVSLKSIAEKNIQPIAQKLQRAGKVVVNRFKRILLPILLGNLYCTVNVSWEKEFFKYIVENKVKSIGDVNWQIVLDQWPFLTKYKITHILERARRNSGVEGLLYEQIWAFEHRVLLRKSHTKSSVLQHKMQIVEIHDSLKESKSK